MASSATSSSDFSGAAVPRRHVPLAVITALASPWVETGLQRRRTKAREQRHHDRAELQDREERDERLRQVRQVDRDDVAVADAEPAQPLRQPCDLGVELAVGQRRRSRRSSPSQTRKVWSQAAVSRCLSMQFRTMLVVPPTHQRAQGWPRDRSSIWS